MRSPTRGIAGLILVVACARTVYAQGADVLRLTLEEAQARAIQTSHRLAEGRAHESAARAAVDGRAAADRPIVAATAGYMRTNHVPEFLVPSPDGVFRVLYPDVPDNYRARLDLQWPIYTGGRADALERAARAEADAVHADVDVARADLGLEVARSFWAVVTARAAVTVLEQGVARAQANVTDVRERFRGGLIPPNEVASAEAQESRQRMLLIEARTQQDVVSADLGRLVGAAPTQVVEPVAVLESAAGPSPGIDLLVTAARESRGERTALARRIDAATEATTAAAAGRKPFISVAAGVDLARPNPRIFPRDDRWEDSWDAGVNLSWSLWDGGRVGAEVAQNSSLAEAARQRLAEFDSVLAIEIRQRLLEIESGKAAIAAADDGVRAAAEALRVVTERYRAGVITQIEVLDAQFALASSRARQDACHGRRSSCRSASNEGSGPVTTGGERSDTSAVQVRHITRRFGSFVAVNDVSFDVRAGEIFGFLGSNGAGKSTTIRMLCGLLKPTTGTAVVGGLDVSRDPEGVKRRIGYMSQRFSLYESLTVDQNIAFFGGIYGLTREQLAVRRAFVLDMAGLRGREGALTSSLSGGWRQRLALGCAILHEPPIVFLDEPTGGVDPLSRRRFWHLIDELARAGVAVLVTTHYLDEAEHCHRIAIIQAGRLAALGTVKELKGVFASRPIIEVRTSHPVDAMRLLDAMPDVEKTSIFGTAVHAVLRSAGTDVTAIAERLERAGSKTLDITVVEPSLEDVFLDVAFNAARAEAAAGRVAT